MHPNISALLESLDLTEREARENEEVFQGPSQPMPHGRVFGGQVLAQSLVAAMRTVEDDRPPHSLHGYFLRPGDASKPIMFWVDRIHDGRSFSTRRTQAYQNGVPILSMIASFQTVDDGLNHQIEMPTDLPDPDSLPTTADLIGDVDHPFAQHWAHERPFDIRYCESPIYLSVEGEKVPHQAVWIRALDRLPDDPKIHRAALTFASDYTILEPIWRRHGVSWMTPGKSTASLDHALWFHRDGRADEWMLYTTESPSAQGGRGLSFGRIYSQQGVLLASVAQEGMVRVPTELLK